MQTCPHCLKELTEIAYASELCPHCGSQVHTQTRREESGAVSDSEQTFISDEFDEAAHNPGTCVEVPDASEQGPGTAASKNIGDTDQTFISNEFDEQPDDQLTYEETLRDEASNAVASAEQTDETAATILSGDVEELIRHEPTSGESGNIGGTDATLISDGDLDDQIARSLATDWSDATDSDFNPRMSIKGKERQLRPPNSTLVIKSKVFETKDSARVEKDAEYELIDLLGKGGMGVVYEARQTSIDRSVAIKMLDSKFANADKHRQKFLAEAVVTGELDHPNVVPIYDVGVNSRGLLFYSMKKVQGTPWSHVIRTKSLAENLDILMRVADAVAFAHSRGIVHRDLKPENVMLGDYGEVLVMDWGLALPTESFRKAQTIGKTRTAGGTPCYMAPEMVIAPDTAGIASDIYLLGAILYEALTGGPPHVAPDVKKCLVLAARNVIQPTKKEGELIDVALKAMATKPEDRYSTVQDFQAAIRDYQSHTESIALSTLAEEHLQQAAKSGDYQTFAKALFGFEESISLWKGNTTARAGAARARLAYAECAIGKDDLELADSLLDRDLPDHAPLVAIIARKQAERAAHQRRLKRARRLVQGLAAGIFLIVAVAFFMVRAQRDIADQARTVAESEREKAVTARQQEEIAKNEAIAAREQEEAAKDAAIQAQAQEEQAKNAALAAQKQEQTAKDEAIAARNVAVEEQQKAEIARQRAIAAKEAEEYEAYIARIGLAAAKIDENAFDSARGLLEACPRQLRQWEWGRLMFLCSQSERAYPAPVPLNALALAPDNQRFATAGWDGQARIWSVEDGQLVATFGHGGRELHAIAFSPDGRFVATAGDTPPAYVKLWSADNPEQEPRIIPSESSNDPFASAHTDLVVGLAFSHDGRRLLTASFDGTARVWDVASGHQLARLHGHTWWVWSAAFCPRRDRAGNVLDETRIVTAGQDGTAIVWTDETASWSNPANIRQGVPFRGHAGPVYAAAFTPDGREVVTAGYDHRLLIWKPHDVVDVDYVKLAEGVEPEETQVRPFIGHTDAVRSFAFSHDGSLLVSCGNDNTVKVWNLRNGRAIRTFRGHGSWVEACLFSHDDRWILSAGYDAQVRRWSIEGDDEIQILRGRALEGHLDAVLAANFSPDGSRIVTASQDRRAKSWQSSTGEELRTYDEGHVFLASSIAFFPDGQRLVTSAMDNTTRIWDVAAGVELLRLDGTGLSAALALTPDGSRIITGSDGNAVSIWDAGSGSLLRSLEGHSFDVTAISVSPFDPRLAVTGDESGRCILWNLETGEILHRLYGRYSGHSRQVIGAAFLPNGQRVLTASSDRTIAQWDLQTGEELSSLLLKHPDSVTSLVVTANGRLAVTGCADGTVRTWDINRAEVVAQRSLAGGRWSLSANARRLIEQRALGTAELATQTGLPQSAIESLLDGAVESSPQTVEAVAQALAVDVADLYRAVPNAVAISASGRVAVVNAADRRLLVWDLATNRDILDKEFPHLMWSAAFDPSDSGSLLALVGGNEAHLIDIAAGEERLTLGPHAAVASASFSPNGQRIVTGSWDNSARVWDAATGKDLVKLEGGHAAAINHCAFSPDDEGRFVLTASDDGTALLWEIVPERAPDSPNDTVVGKIIKTFRAHSDRVGYAAFSPDGQFVVTVSDDKTAMIWSAAADAESSPLCVLRGHDWSVSCAAFSADGRRLITGSADKTALIWSLVTTPDGRWEAQPILKLEGHTASVTSVAFSPLVDGNGNGRWDEGEVNALRALTASEDNSVKLWDTRLPSDVARETADRSIPGAKEILTLTEHSRAVTSVAFSPDGREVLTGSRDGRAILWNSVDWRDPNVTGVAQ